MERKQPPPILRTREDVRRYISEASTKSARDDLSIRRWQVAGRATLLVVLGYSVLQYYFLTVFVEILSLPDTTVFTVPVRLAAG